MNVGLFVDDDDDFEMNSNTNSPEKFRSVSSPDSLMDSPVLEILKRSYDEASNQLEKSNELNMIQRKHHLINRLPSKGLFIKDFHNNSDKLMTDLHYEEIKRKNLLKQRLEGKRLSDTSALISKINTVQNET